MPAAQQILDTVTLTLQDPQHVHWSLPELIGYLNEAQVQIVNLKPEAHTVVSDQALVAGTRQQLPPQGMRLIEITRNVLPQNNSVVRVVSRVDMDTLRPDWHSAKPSIVVQHYMYDILEPTSYLVFPPQPDYAGPKGNVRMITSDIPSFIVTGSDQIALREVYNPALINYVLHRAYAKDSEATVNMNLKALFWQQFQTSLGMQTASEQQTAPGA